MLRIHISDTPMRSLFSSLALWLLGATTIVLAGDNAETYLAPEAFVAETFGTPPASHTLWLSGELRDQVTDILDHPPRRIRERYWLQDNRSLWILEEIGKERPITMGFVIDNGRISDARVLIYRESRGWEIRLPRFTRQFSGAALDARHELDRHIDGITGATLSVHAMQRLARVALLLHSKISAPDNGNLNSARADDTP